MITIGEIINALILAGTAVIVVFYTRAAQKSNEIQERPILNLYLREQKIGQNMQRTLRLRNVGNGPAYNIRFFGIPTPENYIYYPFFKEANPILEKNGDEKTIEMWVKTPGGGIEMYDKILGFEVFVKRLFPDELMKADKYDETARSALVFLITYEGINGKLYYSIFRIYSKIPALFTFDFVVEFISNGEGKCDLSTAKALCNERDIMRKNDR